MSDAGNRVGLATSLTRFFVVMVIAINLFVVLLADCGPDVDPTLPPNRTTDTGP